MKCAYCGGAIKETPVVRTSTDGTKLNYHLEHVSKHTEAEGPDGPDSTPASSSRPSTAVVPDGGDPTISLESFIDYARFEYPREKAIIEAFGNWYRTQRDLPNEQPPRAWGKLFNSFSAPSTVASTGPGRPEPTPAASKHKDAPAETTTKKRLQDARKLLAPRLLAIDGITAVSATDTLLRVFTATEAQGPQMRAVLAAGELAPGTPIEFVVAKPQTRRRRAS